MVLCWAVWVAQPTSAQSRIALEPVPLPKASDTSQTPKQLLSMIQLLDEITHRSADSPAQIAPAFGDCGRLAHALGYTATAAACYRNARRLDPTDASWPSYLALLQQEQGDLHDALASWVNAVALRATSPAMLQMAEVLLELGKLEEAAAVLRNAHQMNPASSVVAVRLGQTSYLLGWRQEAVAYLEQALELEPSATTLHDALATMYRDMGQAERAEEHAQLAGDGKVPSADPLRSSLRGLSTPESMNLLLGRQAQRAGKDWMAVAAYQEVLLVQPTAVAARLALGMVLEHLDDIDGALSQYRQVMTVAPDNAQVYLRLGQLLRRLGEGTSGLEHLLTAVALDSENHDAQLALAQALVAEGKPEESLSHWAAAARLTPTDARAWLGGPRALLELGRWTTALQVLEQAQTTLPSQQEIIALRARVLATCPDVNVRDGAAALELAEQLNDSQPTSTHAALVASALAEIDRCEEAADWQAKAIDLADQEQREAPALREMLERYQQQRPCRAPAE